MRVKAFYLFTPAALYQQFFCLLSVHACTQHTHACTQHTRACTQHTHACTQHTHACTQHTFNTKCARLHAAHSRLHAAHSIHHTLWFVGLPRLKSSLSMEGRSSWIKLMVCTTSMAQAVGIALAMSPACVQCLTTVLCASEQWSGRR